MMPGNRMPPNLGQGMPDISKLAKQAHRNGLLTGFALGFGVGVVLIEIIVHAFVI